MNRFAAVCLGLLVLVAMVFATTASYPWPK
jgi:hypothetical protein